jgi:hypothetical protein
LFTITHAHATQKLLHVCEQVKITWSQVWTGDGKKRPRHFVHSEIELQLTVHNRRDSRVS